MWVIERERKDVKVFLRGGKESCECLAHHQVLMNLLAPLKSYPKMLTKSKHEFIENTLSSYTLKGSADSAH